MTKTHAHNPNKAAFIGLLFTTPFLILNAIVMNQVQPFLSFLRPTGHTSSFEHFVMFVVVFVLPLIGAFIAARPMFPTEKNGTWKFYLFNAIVVCIVLIGSMALSTALGLEIYECDVLKILNCD